MNPSIIEIKNSLENRSSFTPGKVKVEDVEKLIKKIKANKTAGEVRIPTRLVKMTGRILSQSFTDVINTAISTSTFPDKTKGTFVAQLIREQ